MDIGDVLWIGHTYKNVIHLVCLVTESKWKLVFSDFICDRYVPSVNEQIKVVVNGAPAVVVVIASLAIDDMPVPAINRVPMSMQSN